MPISDHDAVDYGFLVAFAEGMYVDGSTAPHDEPRIAAAGWDVVGHLLAFDSVLLDAAALPAGALKAVQLGKTVFYGFLARNRAAPARYAAAVRGTSGFSEWVIDAEFVPRDAPSSPGAKVEQGFWGIYASMTLVGLDGVPIGAKAADGIAEVVVGGATVTVCGHSLGSAIATYLSFDVAKLLGNRASACLFASRSRTIGLSTTSSTSSPTCRSTRRRRSSIRRFRAPRFCSPRPRRRTCGSTSAATTTSSAIAR